MDILIAVGIVGGIGLVSAGILVLASHFMDVPSDEKADAAEALLPGANCGACGYAGCSDYAAAVAQGAAVDRCVPGGSETARRLGELMGVDAGPITKMTAVVTCRGSYDATKDKYIYRGIQSCAAANLLYAGESDCAHGCLGLGDCAAACKFDAMFVENGVAHADPARCTGCGVCAAACPKGLVRIVPAENKPVVRCANLDRGVFTRGACTNGCLGCGKCARACPAGAIAIIDNRAVIEQAVCTGCGSCVAVCPVGASLLIGAEV